MDREAEYARIRQVISELELAGLTIYKIALIAGLGYNTVKHWRETGRVQSYDATVLDTLHRKYFQPKPMYEPQYCVQVESQNPEQRSGAAVAEIQAPCHIGTK